MITEKNVKSTVQNLKSDAETDIKVNKNIENISFLNQKKRLNR